MDDELVFDAVAMRLSAAIEEIAPVGESLLLSRFGDTWFQMKATRNAIAHNYAFVDELLLADTVAFHLPEFEDALERIRTDS